MKITEQIYISGSLQLGISGRWDSHVYVVKGPDGLVMIDAGGGGSGDLIFDNIRRDGLDPADIKTLLLTHNHFDHACGAAEIREATGCAVYLSVKSKDMLERGTAAEAGLDLAIEHGVYPSDFKYRNCVVDKAVEDGDEIEAAGLRFRAIGVEGHSPDSICYLVEIDGKQNLFAGDVLFYGGVIGLINAPGSSMDGYRKELKKLGGLNVDGLFPGHMLFTINGGQAHIDAAIEQCGKGSIPQTIGNCGVIF
ncbi:MAG TPA: MBL fold metallo-hydrolase [Pyrinomonadaceae bacterium]|nr:MBL fold metallo-hydrolase [Pyrinomonadaceae bacterium]